MEPGQEEAPEREQEVYRRGGVVDLHKGNGNTGGDPGRDRPL